MTFLNRRPVSVAGWTAQGGYAYISRERTGEIAMSDEIEPPRGQLTVRVMAMPCDTNASGDIFGGWLLSQMDLAGGIASSERAHGRTVTLKLDGMIFHKPVKVGDTLCVYTELEHVGRTSMRFHIEAWAKRSLDRRREKVTEAKFVFVAVDENGRPREVPAENKQ
jgi:acyl-CoA thioesterase YciA